MPVKPTSPHRSIGLDAHRLAPAAALACVALAAAAPARADTITDTELLNSSWSVAFLGSGLGGAANSVRVSSGGNPGSMRRVTLSNSAAPNCCTQSIIFAVHLRVGYLHNPAQAGAVSTISVQEDTRSLDPAPIPQWTGPVIRQDGVYYAAFGADTGSTTIWQTRTAGPYTAQQFVAIDTSDAVDGVDQSAHPNFTPSGAPIEIGFFRALASGLGGSTRSADVALDNLVITITPVPACTGDMNADGVVNTSDLTAFLARFGQTGAPGAPGDFNNDGAVNVADLTVFLGRFGRPC